MSVFYKIVIFESPLSPAETQQRLQRIARKPRTLRDLWERKPANPPEHADFTGIVENGRFKIARLAHVPGDMREWIVSRQPAIRGWITPSENGSTVKILFCDPILSVMAVSFCLISAFIILSLTQGRPLWRLEHLLLALVWVVSLACCRFSVNNEARRSMALLGRCLG